MKTNAASKTPRGMGGDF